jgi:hypothetical protein
MRGRADRGAQNGKEQGKSRELGGLLTGGVEAKRHGGLGARDPMRSRMLIGGLPRACGRGLSGISGMAAVPTNPCQACQAWQAMTSFFWWTVELRHNVQSSTPP